MKEKTKTKLWIFFICFWIMLSFGNNVCAMEDTLRTKKYSSRPSAAAKIWQEDVRSKLFTLLKLDNLLTSWKSIHLNPEEINSVDKGEYFMKEVEINTTPGRRIRVFITFPKESNGPWPAVVCIHGHGGEELSVYDKTSLYKGFAHELASLNYVTIAGFVSQHEVYEEEMILMGERLWDLIRCVDYLESLDEVDNSRIGCAGLSLGGEMAMWLGGMDQRIKATVSAGFLTTMDHMEVNHCMCWKFPGLRNLVDYADIYSLTAPRALVCQNGLKEPYSQFYVPIAREAMKELNVIYQDFGQPDNVALNVHPEGHIMNNSSLLPFMEKHLGAISGTSPQEKGTFTDARDGHVYNWVKIDDQKWMTENLAWLPQVNLVSDGQFEGNCYYVYGYDGNNLSEARKKSNYKKYGTLYNWKAALECCPDGWHLPTDEEWRKMEKFLGMKYEPMSRGWISSGNVGKKLKSTNGWIMNNGTDEIGFQALPAGCRGYGGFESLGFCGYFWTASAAGGDNGWRRGLCGEKNGTCREEDRRYFGISVRCVK